LAVSAWPAAKILTARSSTKIAVRIILFVFISFSPVGMTAGKKGLPLLAFLKIMIIEMHRVCINMQYQEYR
jgi:hypothetical protein